MAKEQLALSNKKPGHVTTLNSMELNVRDTSSFCVVSSIRNRDNEAEELGNTTEGLERKVQDLQLQLKSLEKELKDEKTQNHELQVTLDVHKDDCKRQLRNADTEIAFVKQEYEKKSDQLEEYKSVIAKLELEISRYKTERASYDEATRRSPDGLDSIQELIEEMKDTIGHLEKLLDQKNAREERMDDTIRHLHQRAVKAECDNTALKQGMTHITCRMKQMEDHMVGMGADMKEMKALMLSNKKQNYTGGRRRTTNRPAFH